MNPPTTLWKPKNPHSVEYLKYVLKESRIYLIFRYLHGVLVKNEKITDANKALLVEALRELR